MNVVSPSGFSIGSGLIHGVVPWLSNQLVAEWFATHWDPEAIPALSCMLLDEAWPVRAMAAKALGLAGPAEALDELCEAMRDPEWWVRSNAARALQAAGPDGIRALERMVGDADAYARHQALYVLEQSGTYLPGTGTGPA